MEDLSELPGAHLVEAGLRDVARGEVSTGALLVAIGAPRLRALGLRVPPERELPREAELLLYRRLREAHPQDAYSRYNALIRELVSFEHALEARRKRTAQERPR